MMEIIGATLVILFFLAIATLIGLKPKTGLAVLKWSAIAAAVPVLIGVAWDLFMGNGFSLVAPAASLLMLTGIWWAVAAAIRAIFGRFLPAREQVRAT